MDEFAKYLHLELGKLRTYLQEFLIEDENGWLSADYGDGWKHYSLCEDESEDDAEDESEDDVEDESEDGLEQNYDLVVGDRVSIYRHGKYYGLPSLGQRNSAMYTAAAIMEDSLRKPNDPQFKRERDLMVFVLMARGYFEAGVFAQDRTEMCAKGGKASTKWTTEVDGIARKIYAQEKRSKVSEDAAFRRTAARLAAEYGTKLSKDTVKRNLSKRPTQQ